MRPGRKVQHLPSWQFEALAKLAGMSTGSQAYAVAQDFYVNRLTIRASAEKHGVLNGNACRATRRIASKLAWLQENRVLMETAMGKEPRTVWSI